MFSVHWRRIGLTGKRKHRGMSIIHQETLTKSSPQPLLSHGEEISVQQKKANSSSIFFLTRLCHFVFSVGTSRQILQNNFKI